MPFGEYVPFRRLIELVNDEIPGADVIPGEAEPVLDTPVGPGRRLDLLGGFLRDPSPPLGP